MGKFGISMITVAIALAIGLVLLAATLPKCEPNETLIFPRYGAAVCVVGHR